MRRSPAITEAALEERLRAAALLDAFLVRTVTSDELEAQWPASSDAAVEAVRMAIWHLYDDLEDSRFQPTAESEDLLRRCIDFLRTDEAYLWPVPNRWLVIASMPLALLTLGWSNRWLWKHYEQPTFWPFASAEQRAKARSS